jgi:hypothetical protein
MKEMQFGMLKTLFASNLPIDKKQLWIRVLTCRKLRYLVLGKLKGRTEIEDQ